MSEEYLGAVTKKFPRINRLVNSILLFLVVFAFILYKFMRVCAHAKDEFNKKEYYQIVDMYSWLNLILFMSTCVAGTLLRYATTYSGMAMETAFEDPECAPTTAEMEHDVKLCDCRSCGSFCAGVKWVLCRCTVKCGKCYDTCAP